MVDPLFDGLAQRQALPLASDYHHNFSCLQYGGDADSQCHSRNLVEVAAEESGVGQDGVVGKRLDTRSRSKRGTWLVEGNVSIFADTAKEKLDTALLFDSSFVRFAFGNEIRGISVQNVDVFGLDVNFEVEVDRIRIKSGVEVVSRDRMIDLLCEKNSRNIKV